MGHNFLLNSYASDAADTEALMYRDDDYFYAEFPEFAELADPFREYMNFSPLSEPFEDCPDRVDDVGTSDVAPENASSSSASSSSPPAGAMAEDGPLESDDEPLEAEEEPEELPEDPEEPRENDGEIDDEPLAKRRRCDERSSCRSPGQAPVPVAAAPADAEAEARAAHLYIKSEPALPVFYLSKSREPRNPRTRPRYGLELSGTPADAVAPFVLRARYVAAFAARDLELFDCPVLTGDACFELSFRLQKTRKAAVQVRFELRDARGRLLAVALTHALVVITNHSQRPEAALQTLGRNRLYTVRESDQRTWDEVREWLRVVVENMPPPKGRRERVKVNLDAIRDQFVPGVKAFSINEYEYGKIAAATRAALKAGALKMLRENRKIQ